MANCLGYAAPADRTVAPKVAAAARDIAPSTVARDVTQEVGQAVLGPVAAWVTGTVEHLAGRNAAGDLLVFWWSPRAGRWQVVNASGEAGARIDSPVTAWVTRSGEFTVEHLAGRNAAGDLLVFWWSPRAGRWQVVNASGEAGARIDSPVTAWVTRSGEFTVEHLAGRNAAGDLLVFWWSPRAGRWQVVNASGEAGARIDSPVTAWVTRSGEFTVEHLAGRNAAGDLLVFWWSPRAGRWQVVNASGEAGARIDSPVTAWVTRSGEFTVEHLAGRNAAGDLLVFWWSPRAGRWQVVNASTIAAAPVAAGAPSALLPASGVEMLVARSEDDHLLQFWWSRTLDWQVCDLTRATGRGFASDPTAWLRPSGDGGRREGIAGCTSDAHLVVFTGDGAERGLTDGLQQPFLNMRPTRGARLKVLTILWDPHRPIAPRPPRASVEAAILGATNSVRGYFLENSRGTFTIESAGVVGWYDSDHPPAEYWPGDGKVGRDSGAEAIRKAARDIDFASFDTNRDGKLDVGELFVLFIKPDEPGSDGGGLGRPVGDDYVPRGEGKGVVVDGVRIVTIAEVSIGSPPGPGIVAHELAHPLLELGDMYFGYFNPTAAGPYSLMDQDGRAPHIDPAHKLKLAWLRPQLVLRSGSYELPDVERSGLVLVLLDPRRAAGEYFIVENRWQGSSYDTALDFSGLAVWHVIEDRETYERFPPRDVPRQNWDDRRYTGWSRQGIRMIRPLRAAPFAATLPLWDGSVPATGYDLLSIDPVAAHATLRWSDGTPSGFAVRQLSRAGAIMKFDVEVGGGGGRVVPTVMQMPRVNATKMITNAGLVPAFSGDTGANAWVLSQSPRGGMIAAPGSTVTMRMRTGQIP